MTLPVFFDHIDLRIDRSNHGVVFEVAGTDATSDYRLTVNTDSPNLTGDRAERRDFLIRRALGVGAYDLIIDRTPQPVVTLSTFAGRVTERGRYRVTAGAHVFELIWPRGGKRKFVRRLGQLDWIDYLEFSATVGSRVEMVQSFFGQAVELSAEPVSLIERLAVW